MRYNIIRMAIICPTVTAENAHDYESQLARLEPFARRIHLDFMDGLFTKNQSISLENATAPKDSTIQVDLHLMYMRPDFYIDHIKDLKPKLVIIQAEAEGDFAILADNLHAQGVKVGVALLQDTSVNKIASAISNIDHVLIFSGQLGYFGGKVDLTLLSKVTELKSLKPNLEIAWDGGINDENARTIIDAGVDVLNVGGFIQMANEPSAAYAKLIAIAGGA